LGRIHPASPALAHEIVGKLIELLGCPVLAEEMGRRDCGYAPVRHKKRRTLLKEPHLAVAPLAEARARRGIARPAQLPQLDDMAFELDLCGRRGHAERPSCISRSTSGG